MTIRIMTIEKTRHVFKILSKIGFFLVLEIIILLIALFLIIVRYSLNNMFMIVNF